MNGPTQPGRNGGTLKRGNNPKPKGAVSLLAELTRQLKQGDTLERLAKATLEQAEKGNGVALKLVWDRIEGPVTEKVDGDIRIKVEFGDDPSAGPSSGASDCQFGSEEV